MARVVVVGGGFGSMAAAARLAKLGHDVTLLERSQRLGGALSGVERDGFVWDAGPASTLMPAVVRDLFRKSGRPLESELGEELVSVDVLREHRFADRTSVRLPGGSRADQLAAMDEMAPGAGRQWVDHVAAYGETWEVLRRQYLETPWTPEDLPRAVAAVLDSRETLRRRLRRDFTDERLRLVAGHPFSAAGHDLRDVPAWAGLSAYLEQRFGAWTLPGGLHRLTAVLAARLATRKVQVALGSTALDLALEAGRVRGVHTELGDVDADIVVCGIDPRLLPTLRGFVERTMPALPPRVCHVGLRANSATVAALGGAETPGEVVLHDDATLVVRPGGTAPAGHVAWTILARGRLDEDLLTTLARHDLDVRDSVVSRVDLSALDQVRQWGGSPLGVRWQGRGTVRQRLGPRTPVAGVYAVGAHATPGAGLPFVGLSAALVAQCIGPA